MALVSVIIPFYNQFEYTELCLNSLLKNTRTEFELILIDNGSDPETSIWLEKQHFKYTLIRNSRNEGAPHAFNQGIELSDTRYVVFLNNDTIPTDSWLKNLVYTMEKNPEIGIAGSWLNPYSSPSGGFPDRPGYRSIEEINRTSVIAQLKREHRIMDTPVIPSTSMITRRSVIDEVGKFDENYGLGTNDDHDFCLRVSKAGYRIVCVLDSFVYHFFFRTLGGLDIENLDRKNREYFVKKYGKEALEYLQQIGHPYGSRGEKPYEELLND